MAREQEKSVKKGREEEKRKGERGGGKTGRGEGNCGKWEWKESEEGTALMGIQEEDEEEDEMTIQPPPFVVSFYVHLHLGTSRLPK